MRLSTESSVAVSTTDRTAQSTLWYCIYTADFVLIPNIAATDFDATSPGELNLALALTLNKNYDVFIWNNAGIPTLALSSAWTNDTSRNDMLSTLKGITVNSTAINSMGAMRGLWIGTIRASGTNTTEDSATSRFVWNRYNRTRRYMAKYESTPQWTYTIAAWRQANATTANRIQIVTGLNDESIIINVMAVNNSAGNWGSVGIGIDSTTTNSGASGVSGSNTAVANICKSDYLGNLTIGYHSINWLESISGGTVNFYCDTATLLYLSGITANITM